LQTFFSESAEVLLTQAGWALLFFAIRRLAPRFSRDHNPVLRVSFRAILLGEKSAFLSRAIESTKSALPKPYGSSSGSSTPNSSRH